MASEWYPFNLVDRVTLDSAGAGQASLKIGSTEEFEGESIDFVVSDGTFVITAMSDQGGKGLTNASSSDPLPSAFFLTTLFQRKNNQIFSAPLRLVPDGQFFITFASGTASATIDVIIKGKKRSLSM